MKRYISLLLSVIMLFSFSWLTSCAGGKTPDVHVFYYTYSDTYISSVRTSLDQKLTDAGVSYQDYDASGNQTTQTEQVQTAITKGAKVVLVNIVNTGSDDAATGIVNLAKNANVPVIFFNREVSDDVINSYDKCAFIGTRAEDAGILQGEMIGNYVVENYQKLDRNGDGKISYIMFKGEEGNNEAIYRTKYSVEEADKILAAAGKSKLSFYDSSNSNKYLVDRNGQWSASAANEYMTTALSSYNDTNRNMIELVICNNDAMAQGAITALSAAGFNNGDAGKFIPVFGVDATDAAKELIKNKKMAGTINQDADLMASALISASQNAIADKALFEGMGDLDKDENVMKIRIPYSKYLG